MTTNEAAEAEKPTVDADAAPAPIDPHRFYPDNLCIERRYFGLGQTQYYEAVKAGQIPASVKPYPGSKRSGHFGSAILKHQRALQEAAERETSVRRAAASERSSSEPMRSHSDRARRGVVKRGTERKRA